MARPSSCVAPSSLPALLVLAGVAIVIAAQFAGAVPITGAIALVAWGTCLSVRRSPGLLALAAAVYAPLGVVAVTAQIDLALRSPLPWRSVAALDAAVAIVLLDRLAHQTGHILAARLLPK
ncbi:MAG: hypothetical protein IT424_02635 [Pirellulales bacterium]|nr:hypothetical protein [Pirellulales bacterium]